MAVMPDGKSHAGSFVPFLKQLVKQDLAQVAHALGHNVTIYMDSYRHVSFSGEFKEWYVKVTEHAYPFDSEDYEEALWKERFSFMSLVTVTYFDLKKGKNYFIS
ncbi:unnamed protein product [Gongylonema pulchrum]|uniref:Peptidase_M1 domain-containing protein n=1 Tax=Gongylonema pulchrum TaxID=637853 RepID=A0A183DWW9_9BILA|nr:unnamed protein product [Gongylonema pulchrum]